MALRPLQVPASAYADACVSGELVRREETLIIRYDSPSH